MLLALADAAAAAAAAELESVQQYLGRVQLMIYMCLGWCPVMDCDENWEWKGCLLFAASWWA